MLHSGTAAIAALAPLTGAVLLGLAHSAAPADTAITATELSEHVHFLASDELEGRDLGSQGLARAAAYLAAELESYGLEPAGDDGTFLQRVPFVEESYTAQPELVVNAATALAYGSDFRVRTAGDDGSLRVVAVPEGGELPEASPDLAVVLLGRSLREARDELEAAGHERGRGFGAVVTFLRRAGKPTDAVPRPYGPRLAPVPGEEPVTWLELGPELVDVFQSGDAEVLAIDLHLVREDIDAHNVIGRLPAKPGSPLAEEAIVVSAHYDHIGTLDPARAPEPEDGETVDLIRNGADDDASGVATVLEIAEALAAEGSQEREVLFLLATAEEIGILGTKYYLDHPSTPLERTVANLNFEVVGRPDESIGGAGKLWLSGAERTNLMEAYAAEEFAIFADPYPQQNFFQRSDNIVFCYRGIVGQTFSSFNLHEDYHQVTDEADRLDYEHMQGCAVAGLQAVRLVADGTVTPEWKEGGMPEPRRR